jgi:hypothetical protein
VVEIRYFTSGISWAADYVAEAALTEKTMDLAGAVRVNNRSGEDYENAQVRLIVGVIRLVENISQLAQPGRPGPGQPPPAPMSPSPRGGAMAGMGEAVDFAEKRREIVKEGLSEYFMYTVEGRDTIPNGWGKRLPSFAVKDVPIASLYKYERERWGNIVMRYYKFTNSVPSKLGTEPLPDGAVKAFRFATDDKLYAFVGRTAVKYIPVNEAVELELGNDLEVLVKPVLMNWTKTDLQFDNFGNVKGWTTKETWEFEVQNSKEIDVLLDIRRNFTGDWAIDTTAKYEKVDATKIKFLIPLKAHEQLKFSYELTTRHGSNVTK